MIHLGFTWYQLRNHLCSSKGQLEQRRSAVLIWTVYKESVSLPKANRFLPLDFQFYYWGVLGAKLMKDKKKKIINHTRISLNTQVKVHFFDITEHPSAYLEVNDNHVGLLHWCIWKTRKLSKLFPQDEHIKQLCPEKSCSLLSSRSPEAIGFTSKPPPS